MTIKIKKKTTNTIIYWINQQQIIIYTIQMLCYFHDILLSVSFIKNIFTKFLYFIILISNH